MRNLLQGVVKDHRLPMDYTADFAQPPTTKRYIKALKRQFLERMLKKQVVHFPIFGIFGVGIPFFFFSAYYRMKTTGSLP